MKIFVINPGSTSGKFALFVDGKEIFTETLRYSHEQLKIFDSIYDQLDLRVADMMKLLAKHGVDPASLDGIAARGGMLPPLRQGGYLVDERLIHALRYEYAGLHGSNLGGLMAAVLSDQYGMPAYIYDAVSTDEMFPEARLSGIKDYPRKAFSHALNTRAVAIRHAEKLGKNVAELNLIVAHLGGGISLNVQSGGRIIDTVAAQEGPYSTERAGSLDVFDCAMICEKEGVDALRKYEIGNGGFASYLGTNDAFEVRRRVEEGDEYAALVMRGMALQVAKYIALLAVDVKGRVDGILITGGMAHWPEFCEEIAGRVRFIAEVTVYPGEFEMQALANGITRILKGEEKAHLYGEREQP